MKIAADYDVTVIGGGSAGLAAAVSAARTGARTLLLERHGYLGGMGTASLVHTFCGLYLLRDEPGAVIANEGFPQEIAERMIEATGIGPQRMGRLDVLPQHPVEFARIADELVAAETSLELRLHTEVYELTTESAGWKIRTCGRAGGRFIHSTVLVDATGDAEVSRWIRGLALMTEAPQLQRPAFIFAIQGLPDLGESARLECSGLLVEGLRAGRLAAEVLGMTFRASGRVGEVFASIDLPAGEGAYDPFSPNCLTALETTGRGLATAVLAWFKEKAPAWRQAYVSHWPARAGVRESRRWVGEHVLTGEEILSSARFEDEIALATWPMEFRENAKGPKLRYPRENRPAGIPLRCLIPKGIERLFVAGRCISTDHDAQASIRVMGTCFATGQAAGRAAAKVAAAVAG